MIDADRKRKIRTAVKRGIRLMDAVAPKWYRKISLSRFDLASGSNCILGQAYQEYTDGLRQVAEEALAKAARVLGVGSLVLDGLPELDGYYYGFAIPHGSNEEYDYAGQFWIAAVERRKYPAAA